ncbi:GM14016 [Drosophila sechellia]|uniref:GM14016 n=1 Tax=Drosophila sechellia TaxID=7238 RepID=B4HTZ4_DROSE|nr:GM14016 [Drosophila sechellia]
MAFLSCNQLHRKTLFKFQSPRNENTLTQWILPKEQELEQQQDQVPSAKCVVTSSASCSVCQIRMGVVWVELFCGKYS